MRTTTPGFLSPYCYDPGKGYQSNHVQSCACKTSMYETTYSALENRRRTSVILPWTQSAASLWSAYRAYADGHLLLDGFSATHIVHAHEDRHPCYWIRPSRTTPVGAIQILFGHTACRGGPAKGNRHGRSYPYALRSQRLSRMYAYDVQRIILWLRLG
ncbi:hypothetical protein PISMIDRAFT_250854 [Pisolithus microcarpus 441]|uniref:Uncharacterized protein n=1 Tax=Pisolithus microcarpus 441 TaxID=765257 RepID=A0A0C9YJ97_9AGAM|nr:hypothetical protein PISMIDRAFT_250854 [Pisolithus microcarpus 441]